ncbi:Trigger factor [Buchnera aphidicola (Phyllaphis fagi)]|uniref:trigger factor n=1 Tax=Buchnera aphidicola TaxID=9 RepID=UPI003463857C
MKFHIEKLKNCKKKIIITIPFSKIEPIIKEEIIKTQKNTIINGFRKNKTPINIIENRYGELIKKKIINKIMHENLKKIIKIKKINIINNPKITINQCNNNHNLIYSVEFYHFPKINFQKLKDIKIQKLSIKLDKLNIQKIIEKLRHEKIIWKSTNQPVQKNNQIFLNCTLQNKNYHNQFQYQYITNIQKTIPQLEEKIINKKIGDCIEIDIQIHKEHPELILQGKKIHIKAQILNIEQPTTLFSKEKFIQYLMKKFKIDNDIKKLHIFIKNNIKQEINNLNQEYLINQYIKEITNMHTISIPNFLLQKEINIIKNILHQKYIQKKGNILESIYWTNIKQKSIKQINTFLIMQSIINQKKIKVTEVEIEKFFNQLDKKNMFQNIPFDFNQDDTIKNIHNIILKNKIYNFILKSCSIIKKKCNLKEAKIINKQFNLL